MEMNPNFLSSNLDMKDRAECRGGAGGEGAQSGGGVRLGREVEVSDGVVGSVWREARRQGETT